MTESDSVEFPAPTGEMAALVREKDWSKTPLGPRDQWPAALRVLVDTLLAQPFPMLLRWGPELVQIYNDGYRVIAQAKHPHALGQPTYECWPEVAAAIRPLHDRVLAGESLSLRDQRILSTRTGVLDEGFFTVSYSPARDDSGAVRGILAIVTETTAHVVADRERTELEEQRQLALEAGRMGWWHLDPESGKIFWDERLRRIFGITDTEMTLESVLALIVPEDRPRVAGVVQAAIDPINPQPYHLEYRFRHPDGTLHWMRSVGEATFTGEGAERRAVRLHGTAADVTLSKRAEIAANENAERLSLALAAADLGDWSWDPDTDVLTMSPRASEIYGTPPGVTVTRTEMRKFLLPEDAVEAKRALDRSLAERTDYDVEYRVKRSDGTIVWVAARGRGVFDEHGKIKRMLGVVQDITRSRQALQRIETERSRLSAALMQSPAFMCVLRGPDHVFEFANDKYYQLVGRRDIIGKPMMQALPEVVAQGYVEVLNGVLHSGRAFVGRDLQIDFARVDAGTLDKVDVDFVLQPLAGPDGVVTGILVHGVDITEKKRIQVDRERLLESERAARAEAERASRMKDEFLATVSHELRTPLSAILGWTQVLKEIGPGIDQNEALDTIERNARAQAQIVEDLLDMSRIISGKLRLDVQSLDLGKVIQSGLETAKPAADAKGVRIVAVFDPIAGPVKGDPSRLQQVVWNLLSNAIKFTPRGGRVQVSLERVDSHVEIVVADSGSGIAPEFLPYVFDRFRQSDSSSTRRHGGLGLGLAIVKQLVELHGGTVRAQSSGLGLGSTFVVALPLMPTQLDLGDTQQRRHPTSSFEPAPSIDTPLRLDGLRILAVDDEPDTRAFIKRLLENYGAYVTIADSAASGMESLRAESFNVLVSDIGMPREDGYEFIRQVRALPPQANGNIPALAITAYARSEDRMRAIRAGFQMHLAKPVENVELLTMVASLAGRR